MLNLAIELHNSTLYFQRLIRKIRHETPFPLRPIESIILSTLYFENGQTSKNGIQMSKEFGISTHAISRLLKKLEHLGYASPTPGQDSRVKHIKLTAKGEELIVRLRFLENQISNTAVSTLKEIEQNRLCYFFNKLATSLGAPLETINNIHLSKLRIEQWRMTLIQAVLKNKYLLSDVDLHKYHIMMELYHQGPTTFKTLKSRLYLEVSKLSRTLDSLASVNLIHKVSHIEDARTIELSLSKEGMKKFKEWEQKNGQLFTKAYNLLSKTEIEEFIILLQKTNAAFHERKNKIKLKLAKTKNDLHTCRKYFINSVVTAGNYDVLKEVLFSPSNICILAKDNNNTVGVLEADKSLDIVNFHISPELKDSYEEIKIKMQLFAQTL